MTCRKLGVPFSRATHADELTDYDRFVAAAMGEAERAYSEAKDAEAKTKATSRRR